MNLLELQTRANLIVDKVNAYEAQLASTSINEADVLAQHKYADLFCLRPVLKLLLGDSVDKKINRDLSNNTALSIYSSSAPMWNSKLTLDQEYITKPTIVANEDILEVYGDVTVKNGIATGFSTSNYLQIKNLSKITAGFKLHIVFTPTDLTVEQCLFRIGDQITVSNVNGTFYDWESTAVTLGSLTDGTEYYLDYTIDSTSSQSWNFNGTTGSSTNSVTLPPEFQSYIGFRYDYKNRYWRGSIDLSKSYIEYSDGTRVPFTVTKAVPDLPPITDLESYQYYYGYYSDSPLCYADGNNFIVPQNLHINTGKGEYTYTGSNRSYNFVGTSSENYRSHYVLLSDASSSSTDYWRFYNVFFQDTIPASTFTGEVVAWFNTTNNFWYRCTNGSIESDLSDRYCTLIAIANYNKSNGNFESCEVDQFKIKDPPTQSVVNFTSDQHEFMNSIDNYNNNNLITLDQKQSTITSREDRISQGINYAHSASIKDALVTESQLANVFAWNTTDKRNIKNNIQTTHRQVPGIVLYYLGNGYDNSYTATIGCNESDELNSVQYAHPVSYGSWYVNPTITSFGGVSTSQLPWLPEEGGSCCRIFIPGCNYTRGKLESPQQIWQPGRNSDEGIKYQGKAIYHELVFKNRRSGCTDYNLDFDSGLTSIPDNDPQGLATRVALAKQKEFYFNRPWFNELDRENKFDTSALADAIEEDSLNKYQAYALDTKNWTIPTARQNDFDPNTGIITCKGYGGTSNDSFKVVSNISFTNNDPDGTDNRTNSASFCFSIDPTTIHKGSIETGGYARFCLVNSTSTGFYVNYYNGKITLGCTNGNSGEANVTDINNVKYILCTLSSYGTRIWGVLKCYDKDKQYIAQAYCIGEGTSNYNSHGLTVDFGYYDSSSVYRTTPLKIGIKPLGITFGDVSLGVNFNGDAGDLYEVQTYNNLDKVSSTVTTTDHTDIQTDEEFYKNYRLNWDTYAKTYNQPR